MSAPGQPGWETPRGYETRTGHNIGVELDKAEPGDFLEDALLSWAPGCQSAEELAERAMILAGEIPPFNQQTITDLAMVAQDLIDNDPRIIEGA